MTIFAAASLTGCAVQSSSDAARWAALEDQLATYESRRAAARTQLTENPYSPESTALSSEISKLNRLITQTEQGLNYSRTEPISTEPVLIKYNGVPPSELMPTLKVAKPAWDKLEESEKTQIERKWLIQKLKTNEYGVIMESQILDESTLGTNTGTSIGSALAQGAYIDRSFKSGNKYSTTNQIFVGIAGAIAGAAFDQTPTAKYKIRYSVQLADGNIQMTDEIKGDPFRLPATACVQFPSLDISDQTLCSQTADNLRKKLIAIEK